MKCRAARALVVSFSTLAPVGLLTGFALVAPVAAQTPDGNGDKAIARCLDELAREVGKEAGGVLPDPGLAADRARVGRLSNFQLSVTGDARYRRDRIERGRPYAFDCSYDLRDGSARARYRWTGPLEEGNAWPGAVEGGAPRGRWVYSGGVIGVGSGKGLDVSGGSRENAAEVIQFTFRGLPNQLWDAIDVGDGRLAFVSQKSHLVLDIAAGSERGDPKAGEGSRVRQRRYDGSSGQLWRLEPAADGAVKIVNAGSGKCLDVDSGRKDDGANLIQFRCVDRPNQAWRLGS